MKKIIQSINNWMMLFVLFSSFLCYSLTTLADSNFTNDKSKNHQQQIEVTGTVTDAETGDPLPGVNIVVEGTTTGTTTDMDGNYSIETPADGSLIFSFVGYVEQNVEVDGREEIDITMQEQVTELEEVVAVGYGTQQKSQTTGSLSSITGEQIDELPVTDISQALKGNTSGIVALKSGNTPGAGTTIRVRGRRSLTASNDPLFVVDGIPYEGDISDINPRNIQSMEVLKGPSATAIYGSRGANGVVLITTKRGGDYETEVTYSGKYGISEPIGTPDMMTGEEFADFKNLSGAGWEDREREMYEEGVSTDWVDLVLQNGFVNTHNLGVRGGSTKTQFALSADYFKKEGLIEKMDFERYTFRLNLDHNVSDNFQVGTSTQVTHRERNPHSIYGSAVNMSPLSDPYDENGELVDFPSGDPLNFNPLYDLKDDNYIDERQRLRLNSNIYADYDITQNFNYRMNLGLDLQHSRRG
ncbi:MAG: SusC/RagA family TonB-linked outer membrane protein, partial [Bacteroidota bacterium]